MRKELGVLLMEEESGSVAVQLFENPDKALGSFRNLAGRIGQKPQRATFLKIDCEKKVAEILIKDLPAPELFEKLDGYRLGEGPVKIEDVEEDLPKILEDAGNRNDGEVDNTKTRR